MFYLEGQLKSIIGVVKWLVFLIKPLYWIGMWFGEHQRANIIKMHVLKRLDYVSKY